MNKIKKLGVLFQDLWLLEVPPMSANSERVYYAVGRGRKVGVYDSWKECRAQTDGVVDAKFRKFYSLKEAEDFVNFWSSYVSPIKETIKSENLVSNVSHWKGNTVDRRNHNSAIKEKSNRSKNIPHFLRNKNNLILGSQNDKTDCGSKATFTVTPYTSPLPSVGLDFISLKTCTRSKKFSNSSEVIKPKNSSKILNRFDQYESENSNHNCSVDTNSSDCQRVETHFKIISQEHSSSNPTAPCIELLCDRKPVLQTQNSILQSDAVNEKETSEPCLAVLESESVQIKKEVVDIESSDQNKKMDQNENSQNRGEVTSISDKLTSCMTMLESTIKEIMKLNINESGKLQNSLKTLLQRIFNNTNTNIHPQMEPSRSIDKVYEDGNNCEVQSTTVLEPTCHQQSSSQMPYAHLQSLSPNSSFEDKKGSKNAEVLALNLRIDSFEKRFDALLKEIGGIASEMSHLKVEIKELKESSRCNSHSESCYSPKKNNDRMMQTTLNFESNARNTSPTWSVSSRRRSNSKGSEGSTVKRKLSRSDSFENSKRFADDSKEIEDLLSQIKTEAVDYASFTVDRDDFVEVYTDGAAPFNGYDNAKAGIGIWFGDKHPMNVSIPVVGRPTSNVAEIQAARLAIELAVKAGITKLKIFTDSQFLINCATKWIYRWKKNGWTLSKGGPVKNRKDLEELDRAASKISIRWEKVPGHAGIRGNETADRLANEGALKYNM